LTSESTDESRMNIKERLSTLNSKCYHQSVRGAEEKLPRKGKKPQGT